MRRNLHNKQVRASDSCRACLLASASLFFWPRCLPCAALREGGEWSMWVRDMPVLTWTNCLAGCGSQFVWRPGCLSRCSILESLSSTVIVLCHVRAFSKVNMHGCARVNTHPCTHTTRVHTRTHAGTHARILSLSLSLLSLIHI